MRQTLEHEIKLRAGEAFALPELGGEALATRVFVSSYHDTADHRLARHGVTLRHRVEVETGRWQLKLPAGAARLELEEPGGADAVPASFLALLPAYLRGAPLELIARLRTRRSGVRASGIDVVYDAVAVLEGEQVARSFDELELELVEGDTKALRRIEKALRRAGATDGEQRPKVFQALDLDFAPPPARVPRKGSSAELLSAHLRLQYERLLAHDPGTRLGSDDEELHQLRVASRRLRAFLRAGRELVVPEWADGVRDELRRLGGALGPVRDLDVLIAHLAAEVETLGADEPGGRLLLGALERERGEARAAMVAALESDWYLALLERLEHPQVREGPATLAELHEAEHGRLRKLMAALGPDSPDAELHAARIGVKRARYAAELRGAAACVRAAKRLQDVLGEHQDAVVAQERLRSLAADEPEAALAAGRLVERERERAERARREWRDAWRRLAKAARRG